MAGSKYGNEPWAGLERRLKGIELRSDMAGRSSQGEACIRRQEVTLCPVTWFPGFVWDLLFQR